MKSISGQHGLISVIIPVHNVRPYLAEALKSVIGQTYPSLEIILVDDGSTDGSGEMCDRFAGMDSRIKVIHQKHQGLSAARNTGLDLCSGRAIAFLDPDDAFHTEMISKMYRAMLQTGAYIVECNFSKYKGSGKMDQRCSRKRPRGISNRLRKNGVYDCREAFQMQVEGLIANNVWNKLYNKKVWENLRFREGQNYEDIDIILPTIEKAEKLCILDDVLVLHRKRRGSITTTHSSQNLRDRFTAYRHYMDFIRSHIPTFFEERHLKMAEERFYMSLISEYNKYAFVRYPGKKGYFSLLERAILYVQRNINLKECSVKVRLAAWCFNNTPHAVSGILYRIYQPFRLLLKKVGLR